MKSAPVESSYARSRLISDMRMKLWMVEGNGRSDRPRYMGMGRMAFHHLVCNQNGFLGRARDPAGINRWIYARDQTCW